VTVSLRRSGYISFSAQQAIPGMGDPNKADQSSQRGVMPLTRPKTGLSPRHPSLQTTAPPLSASNSDPVRHAYHSSPTGCICATSRCRGQTPARTFWETTQLYSPPPTYSTSPVSGTSRASVAVGPVRSFHRKPHCLDGLAGRHHHAGAHRVLPAH